MWCCYSDTSYGGVCLWWPCYISLLWTPLPSALRPPPPPPPILPEQGDSRRQARCNCILRYAGRTLRHFPGLHLHLRLSDAGTSYTSGSVAPSKTDYHSWIKFSNGGCEWNYLFTCHFIAYSLIKFDCTRHFSPIVPLKMDIVTRTYSIVRNWVIKTEELSCHIY